MLECRDLSKTYEDGFTLKAERFHCAKGECIAVLGVNGAGKSTFFEMLSANLEPSSGQVVMAGSIFRLENTSLKQKLGYLPQKPYLPPWASGFELLQYAASLYEGISPTRIEAQIAYWDCKKFQDLAIESCSHGMQKRIGLAIATLHDPEVLILDEPFSGLDILHTKALENEIVRRSEAGKATILSTHVLPYVVRLCKRVYTIKKGQLSELADWDRKEAQLENIFW